MDAIYEKFNLYHPEDYTGHSLSVGDVILVKDEGSLEGYYVDTFGFTEIPEVAAELSLRNDVSRLAKDLDHLAYEHDFDGYRETVDSREVQVQGIEESIIDADTDRIHEWLDNVLDEPRSEEEKEKVKALKERLEEIEKQIEKEHEKEHEKKRGKAV